MPFRTWWLETKLRRIDEKLRRLRFAQKRVRDRERALHAERNAGLDESAFGARESKLHADRDALARSIGTLMDAESRIKHELRQLGVSLAAH